MHVACADRTDKHLALLPPQRECDQDVSSLITLSDGLEPRLALGMCGVGKDGDRLLKQRFNLDHGDAVFPAFFLIAGVPIESIDAWSHIVSVY